MVNGMQCMDIGHQDKRHRHLRISSPLQNLCGRCTFIVRDDYVDEDNDDDDDDYYGDVLSS